MGLRLSTNSKQVHIDTSLLIKRMSTIIINNRTDTYSSTTNVNKFSIINKGTIEGNINISQKIDVNQTIQAKIDANITNLLKEEIQNRLNAEVDQSTESAIGSIFLGIGVVDNKDKENIKKSFEYSIEKNVTQTNIQNIINKTVNINEGKITNEGTIIGDVTVDQKIAVTVVVINILSQIFKDSNEFLTDNGADLKIDQSTDTRFTGLETYTYGFACISSFIMCCICLILILVGVSSS